MLSPSGIIGYGVGAGTSASSMLGGGGYLCYPDDEMMSTASTTAPDDDGDDYIGIQQSSSGGEICDYSSINNYRTTPNPNELSASPEQPPNTTYVCL